MTHWQCYLTDPRIFEIINYYHSNRNWTSNLYATSFLLAKNAAHNSSETGHRSKTNFKKQKVTNIFDTIKDKADSFIPAASRTEINIPLSSPTQITPQTTGLFVNFVISLSLPFTRTKLENSYYSPSAKRSQM